MTQPTEREVYNSEIRRENQVVREESSTSVSLILGILLTSLAAIGVGALFFLNQRPDTPSPTNRTTIIERTKETVPELKAPDVNISVPTPPPVEVPEVNVNVPNPAKENSAPASVAAPKTENSAPTSESAPATEGNSPDQPAQTPN